MSETKLSKKYIGTDQVGSVQIDLENNLALKSKAADGLSSQDLLKLDSSNQLQLLKQPYLPGDAVEALQAVSKQQVDAIQTALDARLDALETFDYAQEIYVAKSGNDLTGDGSQHNPFLTVSAAMAAISDNSPSKRYAILIQAGNYTEASVSIKPNVYLIGQSRESVRITGAVSMDASFSANSSFDNRSGAVEVTFLSAANFNWTTVTSAAGKLYFSRCQFVSTLNMYGYNNAIAQAQFDGTIFFGAITISGINVGVFSNNICYSNINLNQHPNGGMATILNATGGYCTNLTQTTTVNDFGRRCASFLRSFQSENLIVDGPSSYADFDLVSGSKQGAQNPNGGNLVPLIPKLSQDLSTQMIKPKTTNAHNSGDWGTQWFFNFAYVHASSGTDMYLASVAASYDPAGDTTGKSIFIQSDAYGLQSNVNGGDISLETAAVSGTGVRGKIALSSRIVEINSQLDMQSNKIVDIADPTDPQDAASKAYVDAQISGAGLVGGDAISISSGEVNALVDSSTISINGSNQLQVAPAVISRISTLESEMDTAQADIISLDGRVDTLESEMDAAQSAILALQTDVNVLIPQMSQAQSDILSLDGRLDILEPKVSTLESEMDAAQASIISLDGRLDILEPKVSTLESEMDQAQADIISLDGRVDTLESEMDAIQAEVIVLEERSEIIAASAYNSFASVYADGQPGQLDPTSSTNPRHGWYYKNSVAGQKINWYFFDGLNQANITLGDFSAYAVMTFDVVRSPILAVYTVPTGSGDAIPGFAKSRQVYSGFDGASPAVGQKCIVYFGQEPVAHPELPRFKLLTVSGLNVGPQSPSEQVLTSSFGSDSGAAVNGVQYMVESLGIESPAFRGEVDLEIRPAFRQIDGSVDMLNAKISNLADPSLAQDAATKAYVDSRIAAGTDYEVQKVVLSAADISNQYIDLSFKASLGSVICSSDRVNLIVVLGADADADFQQDNSGSVTRLIFQGPSASAGASPLEQDQIIYFNYVKA
jgi:polyhydroxyalkanoate synthesis regulator phasin